MIVKSFNTLFHCPTADIYYCGLLESISIFRRGLLRRFKMICHREFQVKKFSVYSQTSSKHYLLTELSLQDKYSFNAPTKPDLKERINPGPGNSAQERRTKLRRLSSSSAGTIQYLYTDDEEGYSLIETWFSTKESPSSQSTPGISLMNPSKNNLTPSKPNQNSFRDIDNLSIGITNMAINDTVKDAASDVLSSSSKKGAVNHDGQSLNEGVPEEIRGLSDSMIRNKLIAMGDTPGPIVTTTRKMYEQRLLKIEQDPNSVRGAAESLKYRGNFPIYVRELVKKKV